MVRKREEKESNREVSLSILTPTLLFPNDFIVPSVTQAAQICDCLQKNVPKFVKKFIQILHVLNLYCTPLVSGASAVRDAEQFCYVPLRERDALPAKLTGERAGEPALVNSTCSLSGKA